LSDNPQRSVSYVLAKPVSRYVERDILLLDENTITADAARMMQHRERDDIIVTSNGDAVGIVTDEDIIRKVSDVTVTAETTKLKDIMTYPLITVYQDTSLQKALHIMRDNEIRKLPVLSLDHKVFGIIYQATIANVIRDATATQPRLLSPPIKAILGNLGFVLQFAGVLLLVPAILATVLGDTVTATGIYLTTVLLLVTGFFLNSYGEKASLNLQQASILVFSSLFILILFGTIPYLYVSPITTESSTEAFANSFFSSAAGFTTGGLALIDKPEELPQSFTFYRSYTQLVGGMSFIYLVLTAFYSESKLQSMRGFLTGRTLHLRELFATITIIFTVYVIIVAILLYFFGERNIIDNFSLAMSTLSTGGFVPSSTILENLIWQEYLVLIAAMILGALPFTFHYAFVRKKFMSPQLGTEILVYFGVLAIGILLFVWISGSDILFGAFHVVSASTTTGNQQSGLSSINVTSEIILIILMLVGGCGFSTSGGIKIFRFFSLVHLKSMLKKNTRAQLSIENKKELLTSLIIIALFPILTLLGSFTLMSEGHTFGDSFFDATAAITTGGLSTDAISLESSPFTKMIFSFLMIIGRLEIIAIIYIFIPKLST